MIPKVENNKLALPGAPQLNVDLIFYPAAIQNSLLIVMK